VAIGPEDVRHIAQLARLELPEDRLSEVAAELSTILAHMAAIADFQATSSTRDDGPASCRRPDVAAQGHTDHLVQAPTDGAEVLVPPVKDAS
jgi:Asp-tRNA(Asn)/Glu-tRNA(Gln) amidotransferase C subunit